MSNKQRTMKPSKAFALMGIAENTGYRLIKDGYLQAFKIGSRWYIPISAIQNFVNNK